jgi:hypothetical protein
LQVYITVAVLYEPISVLFSEPKCLVLVCHEQVEMPSQRQK